MVKLLATLGFIVAVFFSYPLLNEDTSSECSAYEKRALRVISAQSDKQNLFTQILLGVAGTLSNGYFATTALKEKYPNLPPAIVCAFTYWRLIVEPTQIERELRAITK